MQNVREKPVECKAAYLTVSETWFYNLLGIEPQGAYQYATSCHEVCCCVSKRVCLVVFRKFFLTNPK